MSDTTARTIRLVKAQGIREAAAKLHDILYPHPDSTWARNYNFAIRDAINELTELAGELEKP